MEHRQKLILGTTAILVSALFYSFYSAGAKMLGERGATFYEMVFFVFFTGWIFLLPYALKKGLHKLKTHAIKMHILRACFGLGFMYAFVASLKLIPLVDAVMLNNTAPLFMPFLAYFWLGCKFNHKIWFALILGIGGIALILKPDKQIAEYGSLVALLSGIIMAFSWISVRKLSKVEPVYKILFYYFFFASIFTLIPLLLSAPSISLSKLGGLVSLGILFLISNMLLTYASTHISMVAIGILFYTLIIFSGILNWLIWQQIPDMFTVIGCILVIAGGVISIIIEKKVEKSLDKAKTRKN